MSTRRGVLLAVITAALWSGLGESSAEQSGIVSSEPGLIKGHPNDMSAAEAIPGMSEIAEAVVPMGVAALRDSTGSYGSGFFVLVALAVAGAAAVSMLPSGPNPAATIAAP